MRWIDTTDLKNWASRRDCQGFFPLVIRHLIRATMNNITSIVFPAGDSIISPGWDGRLESKEETEYIPEGLSVWEIGTNQDIKRKAEEDYQKRKQNPLGLNSFKKVTFIFITPRIWSSKDEWITEKRKEGFWKDVRVYDATILEEWLEEAPAIGAWLAKHIGKYPQEALSVEDWWNEWSQVTTPTLTSELVLAGRKEQVESVKEWLRSTPSFKAVQASTKDEAIAFIAAIINTLPENEKEFYLSKSIAIPDPESFRHITTTCKKGLFLIPQFEETEVAVVASQQGHHVYIPIGPDNTVTTEKLVLPRPGKEEFISALVKMGISKEEAERHSRDTARSLTVLKRRLSPVSKQPEWAKPDTAREILPALLVGKWNENKERDEEIISELAETSYDNFVSSLRKWLYKPDSPIIKIGEIWRLVSPLDTFFALAPFLTRSTLDKFKKITLKVLGSIDPALELEPEKRWLASFYGKEPLYSGTLREGIAQTLVLIGVFGDSVKLDVPGSAQTWVDSVLRKLLDKSTTELWYSLSDVLPLIAEASPSSFLDAVENSLSQDPPPIMGMFSETKDILTSYSAHPSLLWALEGLAWDPTLLGRVTLILGKLARLDPGGKLANRPADSLRTIFLLWLPHTYANLGQRMEALDLLIEREPRVGWNLLVNLMPRNHDICSPTHKTRWRQFSEQTESKVTIAEHLETISKLVERTLANVGSNGTKWTDIIEHFSDLPLNDRTKLLKKLNERVDVIKNNRFELWSKLRDILSHHRSFPDAQWALPEDELEKIEEIYNRLEPQDKIERSLWLFDDRWPNLLKGEKKDYKKAEKIITQHRIKAIQSIKNEMGLDGLIEIASQTKNPWLVGITTAEIDLIDKEEQFLFSLLDDKDENKVKFVQSYILQKTLKSGEVWIDKLLEIASSQQWSSEKIVNLFLASPQNRKVWNFLEKFDGQIKIEYWKKVQIGPLDLSTKDKIYALKELTIVRRNFTALHIVAQFAEEVPPKLIAQLLKKAALEESIDEFHIGARWDIEKLFKVLDESEEVEKEEIAKLEWVYLPILASMGSSRPPKMLHQELSSNPEFFSQVIRYVYKPRNEDRREEEEEILSQELREQRTHFASDLLHTWKTLPGSLNSGKIDYEKLRSWVDKARELCKNLDRIEFCDIHIGQVLVQAMSDENGNWPPEEVCRIIDEIGSNELDNGFIEGIYNKRGVVTKSPFEGGEQERTLADQFREYADKWTIRYPRTASILRKVAGGYENVAKKEDQEAKMRDLEW